MEYNTSRENIIYPEYGRNIQKLINKIKYIKNKKIKKNFYNLIINLMVNINKNIKKDILDYKKKLWLQIYLIYKKKINFYNFNKKIFKNKINKYKIIKLMKNKIKISKFYNKKYKYYGINIQNILKNIIYYNKIKILYIYYIANYMKKNYIKWNKNKYVDDIIIIEDIKLLSKGKINLLNFI
ncbi:MAG: DUF4290 domain-containing protein [Candidatus Shikimatogenerans sp. JK-2022]|nr:DUF4290 domain-containing protein [Candidatus Shikimatogenerans bostrichidophilus]MDH3005060.1 DUF4290 domain-containing protein [Candidatus Shikimatogenerans bostrichidophilus]